MGTLKQLQVGFYVSNTGWFSNRDQCTISLRTNILVQQNELMHACSVKSSSLTFLGCLICEGLTVLPHENKSLLHSLCNRSLLLYIVCTGSFLSIMCTKDSCVSYKLFCIVVYQDQNLLSME